MILDNELVLAPRIDVSEFDYDVFLSFSSRNEDVARPLYERLTGSGLRVFWSDETMKKRVGQSWFRVIGESLESSRHFLLLWTPEARQSKFVQMEYETFRAETIQEENRLLIPLYPEGFGPGTMPIFLRHLQGYSIEEDMKDLIATLGGRYEPLEVQNAQLQTQYEKAEKRIGLLQEEIELLKQDRGKLFEATPGQIKAERDEYMVRHARLEKKYEEEIGLANEKLQNQQLQLLAYEKRIKELEEAVKLHDCEPEAEVSQPIVKGPDRYITDDNGIEFVLIEPGWFMMGSNKGLASEKPVHKVDITRPFYLGRYPFTQSQWVSIAGTNPSQFKGDAYPVEQVSWLDVQAFLKKLNTGEWNYRLPTEAEWEYACRAGTSTEYSFGNNDTVVGEYAWYRGNSNGKSQPVGRKRPNPWGLFDIHGNVHEWVQDWFDSDSYARFENKTAVDPTGAESGDYRVVRGGSSDNSAESLRSAQRHYGDPNIAYDDIGFRLLRSVD